MLITIVSVHQDATDGATHVTFASTLTGPDPVPAVWASSETPAVGAQVFVEFTLPDLLRVVPAQPDSPSYVRTVSQPFGAAPAIEIVALLEAFDATDGSLVLRLGSSIVLASMARVVDHDGEVVLPVMPPPGTLVRFHVDHLRVYDTRI